MRQLAFVVALLGAGLGVGCGGGEAEGAEPSPQTTAGGEGAEHGGEAAEGEERRQPEFLVSRRLDPGGSQSPINILSSRTVPGSHETHLRYATSHERVVNTGHTVQVDYDAGSTVTFDGRQFHLVQFHFHTPSEHLIDGVRYPLEMHAVHREVGHDDRFLVIGVLYKMGTRNDLVDALLDVLPASTGVVDMEDRIIDLRANIPNDPGGFYHYDGSLTTPPYTETVEWLVLEDIREASPEQITRLGEVMGHNARPVQPDSGRVVERCRD